ncbi:hypothetical protein BU16DRAFT_531209 [Lophium mytilinum]|uniref:DUF4211 domain-containing protein n=1 Tax=Lophium mytilinum TaxID=390894 RepID=A0A6A6QDF7_9PEZI|nr:hypothetical protein BU16DRAFT_531209 [Lophium mytilinum]
MKSKAGASKRKRARQTRLNFTPVDSSSPAAAHLSPHVRDRAAVVSYEGSPSPLKRQRVEVKGGMVDDITDSFRALPTPDKSSQSRTHGHGNTSKLLRRQLDFEDGDNEKVSLKRARGAMGSSPSRPMAPNMFGSPDKNVVHVATCPSSSEGDELPTKVMRSARKVSKVHPPKGSELPPAAGRSRRSDKKLLSGKVMEHPPSARRSQRSNKHQKPMVISSDEGSNDGDSGGVKGKSPEEAQSVADTESESDEMPDSSPLKKSRKAADTRARRRSNSFEVPDDVLETEEEDEPVVSPRKRSRKLRAQDSEDDNDVEVTSNPRKKLRRPQQEKSPTPTEEEDDEDEDDSIIITQRRHKPKTPDQSFSKQEKDDLDEDLEFLGSGRKLTNKAREKRATPKKEARHIALEELKRKRAGEKVDTTATPNRSKPPVRTIGDTSSEEEEDEEDDGGFDDLLDDNRPAFRSDVLDMFHEDDEDEGFVVDEDDNGDDTLGAPDAQLPLEFSSLSRAKAKDLFKYAIEWMVQKKINPAFEMTDDVYRLTFQKLDDEVKGLAGSKFVSSVWRPEFTRSIKARPEMNLLQMSVDAMDADCQACNRRNHPATWSIQLTGKPYHKESLEEVAQSDDDSNEEDEDEEDEDDGKEYDADGNELPDREKWFSLGSTCKQNAEMAHILHHWRYHLNAWVVSYLESSGYCTPELLTKRDKMSVRKRRKAALKIVDAMEKKGEVNRLYRDYRNQLDWAQSAKNDGSRYVRR